jgi:group I intron endonuclease
MPYKEKLCGIYSITSPNGSVYVGSSHHIKLRWSEHKSRLRNKKHHSKRLQAAWNKHNGNLTFDILELCESSEIEVKEQYHIDRLNAGLNTTQFVGNVWCNPSTRAKLEKYFASDECKQQRAKLAKELAIRRGIKVDCSDGRSFANLHVAAAAFGIKPSGISYLVKTQRIGKLGVRFKKTNEEWQNVMTAAEQRLATMDKNGKRKRTNEARKKMSDSAKNKKGSASRDQLGKFTKKGM